MFFKKGVRENIEGEAKETLGVRRRWGSGGGRKGNRRDGGDVEREKWELNKEGNSGRT